jgi:hypothetical protein
MSEIHKMERFIAGWRCPECSRMETVDFRVLFEGDTTATHITEQGDQIIFQLGELPEEEGDD